MYIITSLFACLFLGYSPAWAGTDNGKGNGGQNNGHGNGGSDSAPLPINNGIWFLTAAGIVIGYTVIKRKTTVLKAQ